jgi:hypothetical protein
LGFRVGNARPNLVVSDGRLLIGRDDNAWPVAELVKFLPHAAV